MKSYFHRIKPHWELEIKASEEAASIGNREAEFKHLERAHVLGQYSTLLHTKTHILMMLWGFHNRNFEEIAGQIFRIIVAFTKTIFGLIPSGNTGGSNVNPFKKMPISSDLQFIISNAGSTDLNS